MVTPVSEISSVLILKADRLCADQLRQAALQVFPAASVKLVGCMRDGLSALAEAPFDLLLTGINLPDGDVLDLLAPSSTRQRQFRWVMAVSGCKELRVLLSLRELSVDGFFDPLNEGLDQLCSALRSVATGRAYWSPNILEVLRLRRMSPDAFCHLLTPTEQLVLAVIGDGSDDHAAAGQLGMKPASIQSVRRELHRKLGVQHKGQLVRLAVQHGYVRFTPHGILRPGFSILLAACQAYQLRRSTMQPAQRT
jgi:two-component system nitrate/nitrite response regulator NarL